jgi:hypothetical protein
MPRIRTIKPEFATDGDILDLSDSCALFFVLLWNHCDDEGKIKNEPHAIAKKTGRWTKEKVQRFISSLSASGQLRLSSCSAWLQVVNWSHQYINRPIQPKVKAVDIQWLDDRDSLLEQCSNSEHSRQGKERKGKDSIASESNIFDFNKHPSSIWLQEFSLSKEKHDWEELIQKAYKGIAPPDVLKLTPKLAWFFRKDLELLRADLNEILSAKIDDEENRRKYLTVALKKKLGLINEKVAS